MRLMGLDLGDRTIGVALSDELGLTAQGLEVIRRKDEQKDVGRIREIIYHHQVSEIVLGLPKNMNGSIGIRGEKSIAFAQVLRDTLSIPVHLWDERLTTIAAERTLLEADVSRKKRKQVIDILAAQFILQGYMEANIKR